MSFIRLAGHLSNLYTSSYVVPGHDGSLVPSCSDSMGMMPCGDHGERSEKPIITTSGC